MTQRPNNFKVIVGLFLLGCFLALTSYTGGLPPRSELIPISGTLMSVQKERKGLMLLELEGSNSKFGYVSFGALCGKMYEKLIPLKGQRITLHYNPKLTKPIVSQNYYGIYEFRSESAEICSYAAISAMHRSEISFGFYVGLGMIFMSLLGALMWTLRSDADSKSHAPFGSEASKAFSGKIEADEMERRAMEEGERIIGDQWKTPR